jgi:HEPN domain-containing protein
MVKEIRKDEAEKFIAKAENFYNAALDNLEKGRYDVSVFNAAQSIILGNDSYCIFFLGRRPSKDHREAVQLHIEASGGKPSKKDVVNEALEKRTTFGYTEKSASQQEANLLLIKARRFLDWVKYFTGISP